MARTNANIESIVSVSCGIPKYSLNVVIPAIKKIVIKVAPKASIRKTIFGFKVSAFIILFHYQPTKLKKGKKNSFNPNICYDYIMERKTYLPYILE